MAVLPVPLLLAAASVGILHMSAPDHWVTLIVLGRISKWSRPRLMGIGAITAIGHAAFSVLLGFAVLGLGLIFSRGISVYLAEGIGLTMLVGGTLYGLTELRSSNHKDYERETSEKLSKGAGTMGNRFRYFAVLGAALSPDLSILPIFLLAVPIGLSLAFDTALVFAFASVLALLTFVLLGTAGLGKAFERVPPKYNDSLVGFVIAAVGIYVLIAS